MTRYWYEVITTEFVDIDFQEIFDFVKKESKLTAKPHRKNGAVLF